MAEKKAAKKAATKKSSARSRTTNEAHVEQYDEGSKSGGGDLYSCYIQLSNGEIKSVEYEVVDGQAIIESDILLGSVERVERQSEMLKAQMRGEISAGVVISGNQFRWPDCTVPYEIDPALTNQSRVTDAIAHWEANTNFSFVLRTSANQAQFPDYVTFQPSGGCSSAVGRQGGQQFINLGAGCTTGNTIHEIGHAVGLWHEQSRADRDAFVDIMWQNITPGREHNFSQRISDGDDVGAYDYGSIMHYPRTAFSRNGQDTIVPTNPASASIGQRTALSAGDIAAANSLCPPVINTLAETAKEFIETTAETLKERVETSSETLKERVETSAETLKERIETTSETHKERIETAKEIAPETIKERVPETIKERSPETIKERSPETIKERVPETIKERSPETQKELVETIAENIRFPGGGLLGGALNPIAGANAPVGGAVPFVVGTPHQGHPAMQQDLAQLEQMADEIEQLAAAYDEAMQTVEALGQAYEAAVAALAEMEGQ